MREILFRGKEIDYGEWVYGSLVHVDGLDMIIPTDATWCGGAEFNSGYIVNAETIGQYTGLTDKDGKRIFEGDIIKTHYANTPKADFIEQVVFHNGRFCGMYERDKMKMWATLPDGIKRLPMDKSVYMEWCEVIGNTLE